MNASPACKGLRKAQGPDQLFPEHFFHSLTDPFANLLAHLFQAMISLHYVPPSFTHSYIIPIPKGRSIDFSNPFNFRGISINSRFSKIFESVLQKGYLCELEARIHPLQGGFRRGYGTSNTSFVLQEAIQFCRSKGGKCYLAFLDARKAFDTVWHNGLFHKLYRSGLTNDLWFLLYFWYRNLKSSVKWGDKR